MSILVEEIRLDLNLSIFIYVIKIRTYNINNTHSTKNIIDNKYYLYKDYKSKTHLETTTSKQCTLDTYRESKNNTNITAHR